MKLMKLYHGCYTQNAQGIMDDIKLGLRGFFMTNDIGIAREYAGINGKIVCFEVEEFDCHVGTINKGTGVGKDIASGMEWVLKNEQHLVSFYNALDSVYIAESV
jgi:hypothetical protein